MQFLCLLLIIQLALANKTSLKLKSELPVTKFRSVGTQANFQTSSFRCGDVIKATTGSISYKNFEQAQPNERCVWTIRAEGVTSYTISLTSLGIANSVIFTGLGLPNTVQHRVASGPSTFTINNSNVVIVTFYTPCNSTTNGRGFSLWYYSSYASGFPPVNSASEDIILPTNYGYVKFPTSRNQYANNELSVLVFTPTSTRPDCRSRAENELIYIRNQLEGGVQICYDWLSVYVFDASTSNANKWRELDKICDRTNSEVIRNQDIIMLVFRTDSSQVYSGFHLYARSKNGNNVPENWLPFY